MLFQNIIKKRLTAYKMLFIVLCHVKSELQENLQLVFDCLETASKDEVALCVQYSRKAS